MANNGFRKVELYDEIWAEPMTVVARRHHLSDVALRRICMSLAIPMPPRGYWALVAAGQEVQKMPLGETVASSTQTRRAKTTGLKNHVTDEASQQHLPDANTHVPTDLSGDMSLDKPSLHKAAAQIAKSVARLKEE